MNERSNMKNNFYHIDTQKSYIVFIYDSPEGGALDFDSLHSNMIEAYQRLDKRLSSNNVLNGHILDLETNHIITLKKLECTFEDQILKELKGVKSISLLFLMRKYSITHEKAKELLKKFKEKYNKVIQEEKEKIS